MLTDEPETYRSRQQWLDVLRLPGYRIQSWSGEDYGRVWSCHILPQPQAELELSFCDWRWIAAGPIDAGTRRIVEGGFRIIVDKEDRFQRLLDAT